MIKLNRLKCLLSVALIMGSMKYASTIPVLFESKVYTIITKRK
jgi:hypothetical protein